MGSIFSQEEIDALLDGIGDGPNDNTVLGLEQEPDLADWEADELGGNWERDLKLRHRVKGKLAVLKKQQQQNMVKVAEVDKVITILEDLLAEV